MAAKPLKVIVSQAKGLASSSSIYCLVSVLDQAQGVLSEQKTKTMKGSSSPTWNATITFTVDDYFAGIAVQVYERHTIFSDKFLGVVRLKFNTERLENGDDEVDSWFTLSAIKGKSKISGEIHIKVIYGDGSKRKRPRASLSKPLSKEDIIDSSSEGEAVDEKPSLQKSDNWQKKDNMLQKSAFVVIDDKVEKKPHEHKEHEEKPDSARGLDPSIQYEQLRNAIAQSPTGCIQTMTVDDLNNIIFTMINRKNGKTSEVTLMIPNNINRGEFTLWTRDGTYELGRTRSILRAVNKIVESFARKNKVEALPHFDDVKEEKGRSVLLTSGWANLDRRVRQDDETESSSSSSEYVQKGKGKGKGKEKENGELVGEDDPHEEEGHVKNDIASSKTLLAKYIDDFRLLHGPSELGTVSVNNVDYLLRFALTPANFLDPLMAEIWQIKYDMRIILEMDLYSPYYFETAKPPVVRCYQTDTKDLNSLQVNVISFGLQWYLQKRIETFLLGNWPSPNSQLLLRLMSFTIEKIMSCTDSCMICDRKLNFQMLKPTICDEALCLFSHEQFGLGVDPSAEIVTNPEVVDLLISATMAAAIGGDARRFTPFPSHLEVKWKDQNGNEVTKRFQEKPGDPIVSDLSLLRTLIGQMPSVKEMAKWKTTQELKSYLDRINHMLFPLLRWILTSNRAHLAKLKPNEVISAVTTTHQYLLLSSPPSKEQKFQDEKKKYGSFWAFHGSAAMNWHSILRNGLKNLSGTALMSTGAVYGNGIYLAGDSNTSMSYAKGGIGWDKSMFNEGGSNLQLLALCEVINAGYKANPYYVVANEDHVITRYLFVFNGKNSHRSVRTADLTMPVVEYLKYKSY